MSPYAIRECVYTKVEPKYANKRQNFSESSKQAEILCHQLDNVLVSGGQPIEDYCATVVGKYEALTRVCDRVHYYKNNMKFEKDGENKKHFSKKQTRKYQDDQESLSSKSSSDRSSTSNEVYMNEDQFQKSKHKPMHNSKNNKFSHMITKTTTPERMDSLPRKIPIYKSSSMKSMNTPKYAYENEKEVTVNKKIVRFSDNFDNMSYDELCEWLLSSGFEYLATHLPKNIKSGYEFRNMSDNAWMAEFGLTDELERKRLRLKIEEKFDRNINNSSKLSYEWTSQWLDDIGLNQYKYEFLRRKINGDMINGITYKEIRLLGIYNPLHQCSLKRSIQLLRQQKFHPCYLKSHANTNTRKNIVLWTTADVAAWMKNIKMAKKIPRLRNSGINGALMVLEPRFNYATLISALKVKSRKNRKKIKNEFEKLLPYTLVQEKEEQMKSSNYVPIFRSDKDQAKYNELWASLESDDLPLCPESLSVDMKYKVPDPLSYCPIHEVSNVRRRTIKETTHPYDSKELYL